MRSDYCPYCDHEINVEIYCDKYKNGNINDCSVTCPSCKKNIRIKVEFEPMLTIEYIDPAWQFDQTIKADFGKLDLTLVSPKLIEEVAKVREYGVNKYHERDNWKQVEIERYRAAFYRHWLAYLKGEEVDPESGLSHLSHIGCNLMFLMEMEND